MLLHYIKMAIRNFQAGRLIFAGSLITISLGTLCISLLITFVHNELSTDKFHDRSDDIYMTTIQESDRSRPSSFSPSGILNFDHRDYPEIENLVTLMKYREGEARLIRSESTFLPGVLVADSTFFEIFDFPLLRGDEKTVLSDPNSAIITGQYARTVFGDTDPMGEPVTVIADETTLYTIRGVIKDPPPNSSVTFDIILPSHSAQFNRHGADFLLAGSGFNKEAFSEKISDIGEVHVQFTDSKTDIIPFTDIYFSGDKLSGDSYLISRYGDRTTIFILIVIIVVIAVISALNFSNLQIININSWIKNIGVTIINGAGRRQILVQRIVEFMLIIIFSAFIVTLAFLYVLPYFNNLTNIPLDPLPWNILLLNGGILFILALFALIYPAVLSFRVPAIVGLKNNILSGRYLYRQKLILTAQFALTIILFVSSVVVGKQLSLMLDKDLGFRDENIARMKFFPFRVAAGSREERMKELEEREDNYQYILNELNANPAIAGFCRGESPLEPFSMPWKLRGVDDDYETYSGLGVTPGYDELLGLDIVEGRFFDEERDRSRESKVVINQSAKNHWNIDDPEDVFLVNRYWEVMMDDFEIIGVVRDFNFEHLSARPQPLIMVFFDDMNLDFLIRFEEGQVSEGLQFLGELYEKVNPGVPFDYSFLEDDIGELYEGEKRLSTIYSLFTGFAIIITMIGLFTITLYDTFRRTKEIGIRKVNGAKRWEVMALLNMDFLKWVAAAFVISIPVAWYAMDRWLQNFAYRTDLSWWIFALAGLFALVVALITVSIQSWLAASQNPAESLRDE